MPDKEVRDLWGVIFFGFPNALFRISTRFFSPYLVYIKQFELELAAQRSPEEQYATLVHELGHLYCGHLGTLNPTWWPDRLGLSGETEEFEAESVSYLVCKRKGLDTPAAKYLSDFYYRYGEVPPISVECIMKAAGLIERMGKDSMTPRKTK